MAARIVDSPKCVHRGRKLVLAGPGSLRARLGQVMGFVLTIWFFVTPIGYPETSLPPALRVFFPRTRSISGSGYRRDFLEHQPPAFGALGTGGCCRLWCFVLGYAWFYKLRKVVPRT